MLIYNKTEPWDAKVNFVDDNNVVLGYDVSQCCCEHADWFIADEPMETTVERTETPSELPGWNFDPSFFKQTTGNGLDDGGIAIFRIVNGQSQKFIHLFNCHNGYYSHGFEFKSGEKVIKEGDI